MGKQHRAFRIIAALVAGLMIATSAPITWAASHREAPLIALDPTADITDVYAFRSWEDPTKAVFIMDVIPSQVPASGPNFFNFDDDVLYAFHLDVDGDGEADDINFEFRFITEIRPPFDDLPVAYAGVNSAPGLPPAITALDGNGSAGLGLRQRYSVRAVNGSGQEYFNISTDSSGRALIAVPSNVGSRTMPNYPALAAQGSYDLGLCRPTQGDILHRLGLDLRHPELPPQSPCAIGPRGCRRYDESFWPQRFPGAEHQHHRHRDADRRLATGGGHVRLYQPSEGGGAEERWYIEHCGT
jgi:Domain of unknown function (DUF4331)